MLTAVHVCAQVETGSAITWKYPSVVLRGDGSIGEFYSVALTNNYQQVRICEGFQNVPWGSLRIQILLGTHVAHCSHAQHAAVCGS
jgi:hypothetical protein